MPLLKFQQMKAQQKKIKINTGVLQGETMSPTLFNIHINDFVHELEKQEWGGVTFPTRTIHSLLFADDLVLLAPNPINLQQKID